MLLAGVGSGEVEGAEAPAADPDGDADIGLQGELPVAGVPGMGRLRHVRDGQYLVALQGEAAVGLAEGEALALRAAELLRGFESLEAELPALPVRETTGTPVADDARR